MRSAASPLTTYLPRDLQLEAKGDCPNVRLDHPKWTGPNSRSFKVSFSLAAENTGGVAERKGIPCVDAW